MKIDYKVGDRLYCKNIGGFIPEPIVDKIYEVESANEYYVKLSDYQNEWHVGNLIPCFIKITPILEYILTEYKNK